MNASVKKQQQQQPKFTQRERERDFVYTMNWNRKDFENNICNAQNVSPQIVRLPNGIVTDG